MLSRLSRLRELSPLLVVPFTLWLLWLTPDSWWMRGDGHLASASLSTTSTPVSSGFLPAPVSTLEPRLVVQYAPGDIGWWKGHGAPPAASTPCRPGMLYTDVDGKRGSTLYVCEAGTWRGL